MGACWSWGHWVKGALLGHSVSRGQRGRGGEHTRRRAGALLKCALSGRRLGLLGWQWGRGAIVWPRRVVGTGVVRQAAVGQAACGLKTFSQTRRGKGPASTFIRSSHGSSSSSAHTGTYIFKASDWDTRWAGEGAWWWAGGTLESEAKKQTTTRGQGGTQAGASCVGPLHSVHIHVRLTRWGTEKTVGAAACCVGGSCADSCGVALVLVVLLLLLLLLCWWLLVGLLRCDRIRGEDVMEALGRRA